MWYQSRRVSIGLGAALCLLSSNSVPASAAVAGPPMTCGTVSSVSAYAIAADAALVSWSSIGCPDYAVWAYSASGTGTMIGPDNQAGVIATGLMSNTYYTFTVLGWSGTAWQSWSPYSAWTLINPTGLQSAFDGQTLNGWDGNPAIWSAKNGAIDGNTQSGGQLIYRNGNFGTFRIILAGVEISGAQHLGVCFWGGPAKPGSWGYNGCIDVIPPDGSIWDYKAASVRGAAVTGLNKFLQWNVIEILANEQTGEVQYAVDGVQAPVFMYGGARQVGDLGLQIHAHASEVLYKNIYIDPAPTSNTLIT